MIKRPTFRKLLSGGDSGGISSSVRHSSLDTAFGDLAADRDDDGVIGGPMMDRSVSVLATTTNSASSSAASSPRRRSAAGILRRKLTRKRSSSMFNIVKV